MWGKPRSWRLEEPAVWLFPLPHTACHYRPKAAVFVPFFAHAHAQELFSRLPTSDETVPLPWLLERAGSEHLKMLLNTCSLKKTGKSAMSHHEENWTWFHLHQIKLSPITEKLKESMSVLGLMFSAPSEWPVPVETESPIERAINGRSWGYIHTRTNLSGGVRRKYEETTLNPLPPDCGGEEIASGCSQMEGAWWLSMWVLELVSLDSHSA